MPSLCSNRFEGFGPHSSIHPSLPTSCFSDVIVVPLATWLFIAILLLTTFFSLLRSTSRHRRPYQSSSKGSSHRHWSGSFFGTTLLHRLAGGLYILLIIAMLAMISLEIARDSVAELGIGLLPFSYVGVLLALGVHVASVRDHSLSSTHPPQRRRRLMMWLRACNVLFWVMLLVAMAVKAAAAKMEEEMGYLRTGTQAKYPIDDIFVDNLTMVCVMFVLAVLEVVTA